MPKLYPGYREEIRKKIIAEAFALFLENGFERVTMEDVAMRLKVTKPAIYRYFKNKEDLFSSSVVESMMNEIKDLFTSSFAANDLITGAGLYFDGLVDLTRKYEKIEGDISVVIKRNETLHEAVHGIHSEGVGIMQRFFETQIQQKTIHTDMNAREFAVLCTALSVGLTHIAIEGGNPIETKQVWLKVFTNLAGIRPKDKS